MTARPGADFEGAFTASLQPELAAIQSSFVQAVTRAGGSPRDHWIHAGGFDVLLRFASDTLARLLLPAFAHLARHAPDHEADLTIHVWDSASTQTPPPPLLPGPPAETPGAWRLHDTPELVAALRPVVGEYTVLSRTHNLAWFWIPDERSVPLYEQAAPFRLIWHWWMPSRGRQLVHAGAAGRQDGGLLFVGKGGSGKSSTALACLEAGMLFASDDYVLVGTDPPWVYGLFGTAKLEPGHAERFPRISAMGGQLTTNDPMDTDKSVFFLGESFSRQLSEGFPLRAVVVPRLTLAVPETRTAPIAPRAALLALAPSTVLQLPGGASNLGALSALVQRIPCFAMELGTDMAGIPASVERLLDELSRNDAGATS